MRITQVEYRELRTGPGYNNRTIGAVALVEGEEQPAAALNRLQEWVGDMLGREQGREELAASVRRLEGRREVLEGDLARLQRRYEEAVAFLDRLGIPQPAHWSSDLPFD
jgi:hypothetical protein